MSNTKERHANMTAPKELQVFGAVLYKYWFLKDVFIRDPLIFTLSYKVISSSPSSMIGTCNVVPGVI